MQHEPAAVISTITAAVAATLALLVAYGFDVTQEQREAILGITAVLAPIVAGLITRQYVFAPSTVERERTEASASATTAYRAGIAAGSSATKQRILDGIPRRTNPTPRQ